VLLSLSKQKQEKKKRGRTAKKEERGGGRARFYVDRKKDRSGVAERKPREEGNSKKPQGGKTQNGVQKKKEDFDVFIGRRR